MSWLGSWGESWGPDVVEETQEPRRGGAGGGKTAQQQRTNQRNKYLRQQAIEEGELSLILNVLVSQGFIQ